MLFLLQLRDLLLGPPITMDLPAHVENAIKQQQNSSERLISWTLLLVVLLFGTLYFVSPKAFPMNANFTPVPFALAAYFIFALFRLIYSYLKILPSWFLILSIIVDITLLMTLIWSFHIQYHQPASFYLKSPTLLYVFIFIALRTLHFEAKYVLIAGFTAAIGWLTLFLIALHTAEPGSVTRNYIDYMTSNHILIGGEIDKLVTILTVTAILTLAISRARRLLIQSIAETIATHELSKFFIPEIATTIIRSGEDISPGYAELRDLAILHCDIRGFTKLSKNTPPIKLMALLTEYQAKVVPVIRRYNGSIDKFLGDGILASFNAVKASEKYASDAIKSALAITTEIEQWNKERISLGLEVIRIGVCVTTGTASLGIVGDATRREYTIIGDPVNLVAKLDKHCKVEKCNAIATLDAYQLALKQGLNPLPNVEILNERHVAGVSVPVDLVVLNR